MRIAQLCVLGTLLLVFPFASMAGSEGSPPETDSDASTGSTKTHIKYTPFEGWTKIELPGLRLPRLGDPELEGKQFGIANVFPFVQIVHFKHHPREALRVSCVEIPYAEFLRFESLYTEADENPLESTVHEPFFSLFYGVYALYHPEPEIRESDQPKRLILVAARRSFLHSATFFCLWQRDTWRNPNQPSGEQPYHTQWLRLASATTFERKETADSHLWRVLDIPLLPTESRLVTGFWYEREGDRQKIRLLALPVASLYRQDAWEGGSKSAALETPTIIFDWTTAALWQKEQMEDKTVCQQFVRLPLLGPIWSVWNDPQDGGRRTALLPRLLFWRFPAFAR